MQRIIMVIAILLIAVSAQAADVNLNIKIVSEKVTPAVAGFLKIHPNVETIPDPTWVDPEDGTVAPQIAKYATTKAWAEEWLSRALIRDCKRGLQMLRNEEISVIEDLTGAVVPQ